MHVHAWPINGDCKRRPTDTTQAVEHAVQPHFHSLLQNPRILEHKFADRWLLKALGRGLYNRPVLPHEKGHTLLPFKTSSLKARQGSEGRLPHH
jgi:hypothetical protein